MTEKTTASELADWYEERVKYIVKHPYQTFSVGKYRGTDTFTELRRLEKESHWNSEAARINYAACLKSWARIAELEGELTLYQPELNEKEQAALDELPDDLVVRLMNGEQWDSIEQKYVPTRGALEARIAELEGQLTCEQRLNKLNRDAVGVYDKQRTRIAELETMTTLVYDELNPKH